MIVVNLTLSCEEEEEDEDEEEEEARTIYQSIIIAKSHTPINIDIY